QESQKMSKKNNKLSQRQFLNKLEIPYDEFSRIRWLKRSEFGIYKDANWKESHNKVALLLPKEINHFSKLKEVKHDNIVKFHGTTHGMQSLYKLTLEDKLNIAKDIANGLKYLHDEGKIHHGDLHPKSIFIDNKRALITHPTIFTVINRSSSAGIMRDKIPYQDPQLSKNMRQPPSKKSDIYSLGVILWRIFSNYEPFSNYEKNLISLIREIEKDMREKPTGDAPENYVSIYEKCWSSNLSMRPPIKKVLNELNKINCKIKGRVDGNSDHVVII
ncbi:17508_t:CDS:2, partial [Dentiscutata erythropus]